MDKFGRNYVLGIATKDKGPLDLFIRPPMTIEFDITRTTLSSANVGQIRIYNLSALHRNQIRKNASDYFQFRSIQLKAGYGNNLATIFSGNITQAWSTREGTNFITQIESYDGGFAYVNGSYSGNFPVGTPIKVIILTIAATLPDVAIGTIGDYPGVLSRAASYNGSAMEILTELTGGGAFIDNGKFYALGTNEYVQSLSGVGFIDSNSGLLGTPMLEQRTIHFDMIFEPGLNVGQQIFLDSIVERSVVGTGFNGLYKVTGVKHKGMISDAVCGSVITTGEFFFNKSPIASIVGNIAGSIA